MVNRVMDTTMWSESHETIDTKTSPAIAKLTMINDFFGPINNGPKKLFVYVIDYLNHTDLAKLARTCSWLYQICIEKLYQCPTNFTTPMVPGGTLAFLTDDKAKYVREFSLHFHITLGKFRNDTFSFLSRCIGLKTLTIQVTAQHHLNFPVELPPRQGTEKQKLESIVVDFTSSYFVPYWLRTANFAPPVRSELKLHIEHLCNLFLALFDRYETTNLALVSNFPSQDILHLVYNALSQSVDTPSVTSLTVDNFPTSWSTFSPGLRRMFPNLNTINFRVPDVTTHTTRAGEMLVKFDPVTFQPVLRSEHNEGWNFNLITANGSSRQVIMDHGIESSRKAGFELVQWLKADDRNVQPFCYFEAGISRSLISECDGRVFFHLGDELSDMSGTLEVRSLLMQSHRPVIISDEWLKQFKEWILVRKHLRSFRQCTAQVQCSICLPSYSYLRSEVPFDASVLTGLRNLPKLVNLDLDMTGSFLSNPSLKLSDVKEITVLGRPSHTLADIYDRSLGSLNVLPSRR
jgi:hypothetical protein